MEESIRKSYFYQYSLADSKDLVTKIMDFNCLKFCNLDFNTKYIKKIKETDCYEFLVYNNNKYSYGIVYQVYSRELYVIPNYKLISLIKNNVEDSELLDTLISERLNSYSIDYWILLVKYGDKAVKDEETTEKYLQIENSKIITKNLERNKDIKYYTDKILDCEKMLDEIENDMTETDNYYYDNFNYMTKSDLIINQINMLKECKNLLEKIEIKQ